MTTRNPVQAEHERQSQTVVDTVWAVTTTGDTVSYRLADTTPHNGYTYLADVMSRHLDEDAILDSLNGSCDHRVVGTAELDADTGEVIYLDLDPDAPRL